MLTRILPVGLLLGALTSAAAAQTAPELKSVKVELPTGERMFPGGKEADAINGNCLACHSAGMVLNQPALPRAAWDAEVHKMINVYKAPVDEADVAPIVAYLAQTKGKD
ncbi:MAG TPA: cytochrome c [Aliidongia sp.]|nr:cytochrome c [Aliidongia sp.]